jgi:acetyl-CoA carboxylase biotin carboxyl carrier protein
MSGDDADPQPVEDQAVIDPGLAEADDLAQPVAVGPGEPANLDPGHYDATPYLAPGDEPASSTATPGNGAAGTASPATAASDASTGEPALAPGTEGPVNGGSAADAVPAGWTTPASPGDASLLELVDRLTVVLERSDLAELEVASGGTTIILRSPAAIAPVGAAAASHASAPGTEAGPGDGAATAPAPAAPAPAPERPSVKAPLTGIYYGAPSPGAQPYVAVGNHVSAGQIIGLIEAMKLFNEIKSDLSGRVVRICAENGALVKAKQPLIEVEPA